MQQSQGVRNRASTDVPDGWTLRPFDEYLEPKGTARLPSVPQNQYLPRGRFPVVDQGASMIAGYTDDETIVHRDDLPLIVFGDHTRIFKFVDFPFATGADGTKLLKADPETVDPQFLYYAFRNLEIPSLGYSRHYSKLREKQIAAPCALDEQRAIARVLATIEDRRDAEAKRVSSLHSLGAATMAKLFGDGLRGEPLKQTAVGELPASWEVIRLEDVLEKMNYGTSVRCSLDPVGRPVLRIPNVVNEWIDKTEIKYADLSEAGGTAVALEPGDLLFVRTNGQRKYTGRSALYRGDPPDSLFASYLIRARLRHESILPEFAQAFLSSTGRSQITSATKPTADGKFNIDTQVLKALLLPLPPLEEQGQIVEVIRKLVASEKAAEAASRGWKTLFEAMLNGLMSGRVRSGETRADA